MKKRNKSVTKPAKQNTAEFVEKNHSEHPQEKQNQHEADIFQDAFNKYSSCNFKANESFASQMFDGLLSFNNIATKAADDLNRQMMSYFNKFFNENLDVSKDFFGCTTIANMVEFQENLFNTNWQILTEHADRMTASLNKLNSQFDDLLNQRKQATH